MNKKNNRRKFRLFLQLALLVGSLFLLAGLVDFRLVVDQLLIIPPSTLALLVAIALVRAWLTGIRWMRVNPDVSGQLSSWQYFRLVMIAKPFNLIMPGALGGDFVRTALTMRMVKDRRIDNVIGIFIDRFLGLLSITIIGVAALFFVTGASDVRPLYSGFAILITMFVAAILVGSNRWILRQAGELFLHLGGFGIRLRIALDTWRMAMSFFRRNSWRLVGAFLLCLPIHFLAFLSSYLVAVELGIDASFFDISAVVALVWVITAVPLTLFGAGVRELSMVYLFSLFTIGAEQAMALSVYTYVVGVAVGAIGLAFFIFSGSRRVEGG